MKGVLFYSVIQRYLLNSGSIPILGVRNHAPERVTQMVEGKYLLVCVLEGMGWEMGELELDQTVGSWRSGGFFSVSQQWIRGLVSS